MTTPNQYYVYVLTNKSGTLYVGVTNNLKKRVFQHKQKLIDGFTKKYNIDRLIYFETFGDIHAAITREKEIKRWIRKKKIALVKSTNPTFEDISKEWWVGDLSLPPSINLRRTSRSE